MDKSYLTETGLVIYQELDKHCQEVLKMTEINAYELSMLANSFDGYIRASRICNESGWGEKQVRPEFVVMKTEYQNILKHSGKFGLNPADMAKFFSKVEKPKKKALEVKMGKVA